LLDALSVAEAQHAAPLLAKSAAGSTRESPVTSHQSPLLDLIASNPPYIGRREASTLMREVRDHEPEIALYEAKKATNSTPSSSRKLAPS